MLTSEKPRPLVAGNWKMNGSRASLTLVGEIAAGARTAHRLQPNQSVYVATGAPLPTIAPALFRMPT